jgi:hypothetical protein
MGPHPSRLTSTAWKPTMKIIARLTRYALHPAYAIGQRLHLAGISPEGAAILTISAAVAILAVNTSAQDRAFIKACQSAGGSVGLCTLKVSGR